MSTYWYLECISHDPPLSSEDEISQHTDEQLDRVRALWADREALCAADDIYDEIRRRFPTRNSGSAFSMTSEDYFGGHAVRFIVQHPRCNVQMRSGYGDTQPIEYATGAVVISPTQDTQ